MVNVSWKICSQCFGTGIRIEMDSCQVCSGSGEIIENGLSRLCPVCLGQTISEKYTKCSLCQGTGKIKKTDI